MIRKLLVATLAAVVATTMTGQTALAGGPPRIQGVTAAASAAAPAAVPAATAAPAPKPAAPAAAPSATDVTKIPHYFGPYPNWVNSPQTLSDAIMTISPPPALMPGNPLIGRAMGTDTAAPVGTLGHIMVVLRNIKLPTGNLRSFQTWNQLGTGQRASAGQIFYAYVLRPTGIANQYSVVYASNKFTVPISSVATGEVATFPLASPVAVQQNDMIGFYGQGVPWDVGTVNPDMLGYPVTVPQPARGSTFSFGATGSPFPIFPQNRTYSFGAIINPPTAGMGAEATATVDPKTGGISAATVTSPGTGYVVPPAVTITSPGVTPTGQATATAQISSGVITSVAVDESGFGFSKPTVTISGGGTPGTIATATASGGVDQVTVDPGGGGVYTVQPIVVFSKPDLVGGVQATGTATMIPLDPAAQPKPTSTINAVDVVDAGSGYTSAPTVTIFDGTLTQVASVPAQTTATIGISKIDLVVPGAGYTSAPTVTINDTVGAADKGASATATVAAAGAVTGITITAAGAGYLTPGLKKFVDTLPGTTEATKNDLGQYIPIAVPDTTTYPGTDYYEIAVVQYRMKFHRDLPATLLRGYVQLSTSVIPGKKVALSNANLDPTLGVDPIAGYTGVDDPHYLGPTIVAAKNRPVRVLFRNLLPIGTGGDLFLPVDTTLMGSGEGPNMVKLDANKVPIDNAADQGSVLDGVRNPVCDQDPKPTGCYAENRATMHLHGGVTPWISDGTPHQWETPAGQDTAYPKGVSVQNVPDMPDPGPGAQTFFYTNQESARLMWTHDHSWGITRLNVYAGEAAGYLLSDDTEQKLIAPGGALAGLGTGTVLNIQDKTFLPDAATVAKNDPTWNYAKWGGPGSLWTPHVYMPAQNPSSATGMSPFGRWMYGPWFWPPATDVKYPPIANPYFDPKCDPDVQPFCEPAQIPSTPNVSVGMEAFNDTPVVNGTAYPTTTVDPKSYRYRILNDANDRFWNLSWYVADPTTGTLSEVALNKTELAAAQTDPNIVPSPDTALSPAGPNWIQIGNEGGFLPTPAVVPAQPTTYIIDPTRFDVGNVDKHSLLLAPAERADVVVDFSQYRGKTLILYNDAPAAFPGRVSGYDYYTGGPNQAPVGAPTTLAGYGPNTRTVMQVKVSNAAPALAFDRPNTTNDQMGALNAAFAHHLDAAGKPAGVFESSQDPIIVGQAAYNSALGTHFVSNGWCSAPNLPSALCDGFARIQEGSQPTDKFAFNTVAAPNAKLQIPFQPKGSHDEMNSASFDPWGRMTANLGLEAPGATPLNQNIILYPYVNPPTAILDATDMPSSLQVTPISTATDGTQIWKITHNGVDTHPIHFHLFNVQLINRVTWDNIIIPPEPSELGWKETVRVSPLEDTIVALRPIVPTLPFGIPDSHRPLNPAMPVGATGDLNSLQGVQAGFNNTNTDGTPMTTPIVNAVTDFGWEYVFHCHILSHEEMDMMQPMTVHAARALPQAPVLSIASGAVLNWTDGTPVDYANPNSWTNPGTAEVGYRIDRAVITGSTVGPFTQINTPLANVTTYTDATADPNGAYQYRVFAWNAAGDSVSNVITVTRPSTTVVTSSAVPSSTVGQSVTFTATVAPATGAGTPTGSVQFAVDGANVGGTVTLNAAGAATYAAATLTAGSHSVIATYTGSAEFVGSVSPTYTQVVSKVVSTTALTSSVNPSVVGQSVTLTAQVAPAGATGTVVFTVDGTPSTAVNVNAAGRATLVNAAPGVGAHVVTATYSGSASLLASTSAPLTQTVNKSGSKTAVTSSGSPAARGTPVTFTATVTAVAPGSGVFTGAVQFRIDGVNAGTPVAVAAGKATYTTSTLSAATHTVSAVYAGDGNFTTSTSANIIQRIQ